MSSRAFAIRIGSTNSLTREDGSSRESCGVGGDIENFGNESCRPEPSQNILQTSTTGLKPSLGLHLRMDRPPDVFTTSEKSPGFVCLAESLLTDVDPMPETILLNAGIGILREAFSLI